MRAIGFRVEPKQVHYAIVDGTPETPSLFSHGKFNAPKTYVDEAKALTWYYHRFSDELGKHHPDRAGIRYPEVFGRHGGGGAGGQLRLRIEGVLLLAIETAGIPVFGGASQRTATQMGAKSIKPYKGAREVRGIPLEGIPETRQDAIFAAMAALGACSGSGKDRT